MDNTIVVAIVAVLTNLATLIGAVTMYIKNKAINTQRQDSIASVDSMKEQLSTIEDLKENYKDLREKFNSMDKRLTVVEQIKESVDKMSANLNDLTITVTSLKTVIEILVSASGFKIPNNLFTNKG